MTRQAQIIMEIIPWWRDRLDDGCPVSKLTTIYESYDYKGQGPWYQRISLLALYNDFMKYYSNQSIQPQRSEFGFAFRKVCPVLTKIKLRGSITLPNGTLYRGNRTFLDIPNIETCKLHFNEVRPSLIQEHSI